MGLNKPVGFPTAKLLKEKEFDKYCTSGYTESGDVYLHQGGQEPVKNGHGYHEGRNYNGGEFYCSAPTIADVVMWIYEKHGIWIEVRFFQAYKLFYFELSNVNNLKGMTSKGENHFKSPTEAYEAGIEHTLNHII